MVLFTIGLVLAFALMLAAALYGVSQIRAGKLPPAGSEGYYDCGQSRGDARLWRLYGLYQMHESAQNERESRNA